MPDTIKDKPADEAPPEETPTTVAQPKDPVPSYNTVEDKRGIERVVPGGDASWRPAPVEPTEEALAAAEKRHKAEEEAKAERLNPADLEELPNSSPPAKKTTAKAGG